MVPYKRFKLRAHDKGIDRHNKGTAYLRKQERLRQEQAATQPQRKKPRRRPPVKFGSNVIQVDFALRTRINPQTAEQLQALAAGARRSTREIAQDAAARWGCSWQAV